MSQTSFSASPSAAFAGMVASGDAQCDSYFNENAAAQPFGIAVKQGTASNQFNVMSAQGQSVLGFLAHSHVWDNQSLSSTAGVPASGGLANVMRQGRLWVLCEEAVAAGDPVYVRHTANGAGKLQVGAVRNDNDGVQEVLTFTPTAANNTAYTIIFDLEDIANGNHLFEVSFTSDANATAAEIVTGLKAAIEAETALEAAVTTSGTDTLIVTRDLAGAHISAAVVGAGVIAMAVTTAASTKCDLLSRARFVSATTGAGLAEVEINLP